MFIYYITLLYVWWWQTSEIGELVPESDPGEQVCRSPPLLLPPQCDPDRVPQPTPENPGQSQSRYPG